MTVRQLKQELDACQDDLEVILEIEEPYDDGAAILNEHLTKVSVRANVHICGQNIVSHSASKVILS